MSVDTKINDTTSEAVDSVNTQGQDGTQEDTQSPDTNAGITRPDLSIDERLEEAMKDEASFLEQVKVTLLAVNEVYQQYKAIDIHYQRSLVELDTLKKEVVNLSDEFKTQRDEALQKIEEARAEILLKVIEVSEAKAEIESIETRLNALATKASEDLASISDKVELVEYLVDNEPELKALIAEIETKKQEVENLVTNAETTLQSKLDEANANFENKKQEVENLVTNAQSALESSANTFIAQVETRKINALNAIDEKLGRLISNINYVSANEPTNARLDELWLDTNRGLIFKYSKNDNIDFYGLDLDENAFANVNDFWHKDDGSLLKFVKSTKGKIWQEIRTDLEHINFCQKEAPSNVADLEVGATWLQMDWDKVYYLENKSWVQITQKLKRFKQETMPEESKVIELNDIWQKGEGENAKYFIYTQFERDNELVSEWVSLDEAFKVAKFRGREFPQIANEGDLDTNKAQMRDLFFEYDESLTYILTPDEKGGKDWKLLANAKAEAKFQGSKEAKPLKENLYFFKQKSEDSTNEAFYQGELFKSEASAISYGFVEFAYLKDNVQFSGVEFPKTAKSGDLFYHTGYENFYFWQSLGEGNSVFSWRKLDLENVSYLQDEPENAKVGEILVKDTIFYVYIKFADSVEWSVTDENIKPFLFVNEFADNLSALSEEFSIFKESNKGFDYVLETNPTESLNPKNENALILNKNTFEIFKCIDNTENKNVFIGSLNSFVGTLPQVAPGSQGFGVGIASNKLVNQFGLTPLQGCFDSTHQNYGNYEDNSGSIMCFVPKFYVKLTHDENPPYNGTKVEISYTQKQGYFLPRCFINAGKEVEGFFIDKYMGSNESGVMVSKRFMPPLSTWNGTGANRVSPCSELKHIDGSTIPNNYIGAYMSVKSRGRDYALPSVFMYTALAWLSLAHYQACYLKGTLKYCDFSDVEPYQPKGCNCSDGSDNDDKSVKYQLDKSNVYSGTSVYNTYKTASVSDDKLGKISHNGQRCGITDINGMQWEVAAGFRTSDSHTWTSQKFLVLKESVDLKSLSDEAAIKKDENYDTITLPMNLFTQAYKLRYAGKPGTSFFAIGEFDKNSVQYKCNNIGLSYNVAYSDDANSAGKGLGQDGWWQNGSLANMQVIVGGCSWDSHCSGLFTRRCNYALSGSFYSVFARACLI